MTSENRRTDPAVAGPVPTGKPRLPVGDWLFWYCLGLAILFGLTLNLLPVTFKVFRKLFAAGYEMQGRTEGLYFIGIFVGVLIAGHLAERIGFSRTVRVGLTIGGVGCLLFSVAQQFLWVQVGCLAMGMGGGSLYVIYSTVVAQRFANLRQRVFASANLALSIGGTAGPVLMGLYVSTAWMKWQWPWWLPYTLLGVLFLGAAVYVPALPAPTSSGKEEKSGTSMTWRQVLSTPALWMISAAFALHGLGQLGAVVWLGRLYESRLGLQESQVGLMISANLGGFIIGRILLMAYLGGRLPDRILLGVSATIGTVFYTLTILTGDYYTGLALMFAAGLGMSGDAISLSAFTGHRFPHGAAKAFAISQAVGEFAAAVGPYIIGFVGQHTGSLEMGVWLTPITIGCLAAIGYGWELKDRVLGQKTEPTPSRIG